MAGYKAGLNIMTGDIVKYYFHTRIYACVPRLAVSVRNGEINFMKNELKYELLAVDLDGTLLTTDKKISEVNLRALHRYMEAGGRVVVSTGRAYPGAKKHLDRLNTNAPVITNNGAILLEKGEIIFEEGLEAEDAGRILDLGNQYDVSMIIWSHFNLFGNRIDDKLLDYGRRFGDTVPQEIPGGDYEALIRQGITKILWYVSVERAQELVGLIPRERLGNVTVQTSEPMFIEFFNKKVSKAIVLGKVCEKYGIPIGRVMAIGDAENDICMLKLAGLGIAMANGNEAVKRSADVVTTRTNDEDGVAEVIEKYALTFC